MIGILLLNLLLFTSNFCSTQLALSIQNHKPFISSRGIYERIVQDPEKNILTQWLLDPEHDGHMWYLLNKTLTSTEKAQYDFLKPYINKTKSIKRKINRIFDEGIKSSLNKIIRMQRKIFESSEIDFDEVFVRQYMQKTIPLVIPRLMLISAIQKVEVPREVIWLDIFSKLSVDPLIAKAHINSYSTAKTFVGHTDRILDAKYLNDKANILSASDDTTIKLWDYDTECCIKTFTDHSAPVWALDISDNEKVFISGSSNGEIKSWDIASGNCFDTVFADKSVHCLTHFTNNEQQYFAAGLASGEIFIWTLYEEYSYYIDLYETPILSLKICSDSNILVTLTSYEKDAQKYYQLNIWNMSNIANLRIEHLYSFKSTSSLNQTFFIKDKLIFLGVDDQGKFNLFSTETREILLANKNNAQWIFENWQRANIFISDGKNLKIIKQPFEMRHLNPLVSICAPLIFSLKDYFDWLKKPPLGKYKIWNPSETAVLDYF
jgi:WD40 repeat protein